MIQGKDTADIKITPPVVLKVPDVRHYEINNVQEKFEIPADRKIILSLSRLVKYKGIQYAVEALSLIRKNGQLEKTKAHLVIAGGGDYRQALEEQVKQLKLTDHVTFTGVVTDREKNALYQLADVFVLLSYSGESFGITLAEAMSCGTAILGSNRGAVPYVVKDGRNGYIVDPEDTGAVADALLELLANADEFEEINKEDARQYRESVIIERLIRVYEEAIENNTGKYRRGG